MWPIESEFLACGGRSKNFLEFAIWAFDHTDSIDLGVVAEKYRAKHPELRTVCNSDSIAQGTKIMYEEWLKGIEDGKKEENS